MDMVGTLDGVKNVSRLENVSGDESLQFFDGGHGVFMANAKNL